MRRTIRSTGTWMAVLVFALGLLASRPAEAQRSEVQSLLEEGKSLYQQGDLDGARASFEKALLMDVTSEEAMLWVDKVGYALLIEMIRSGNDGLAKQVGALEAIVSTETRRRSSDRDAIEQKLSEYFATDDIQREHALRYSMVNEHGTYLVPGLVARLASAEQPTRVRSILALSKLGEDAELPLSRALQSSDPAVALGSIAALKNIGSPAASGALKLAAEVHGDRQVQEAAAAALHAIAPDAVATPAHDLLLAEATRFYMDSSHLNLSYHDSLIWKLDGDELTYETVPAWALNELRAAQIIRDALTLSPNSTTARVLDASNSLARYAEYVDVSDVVAAKVERGELEESKLAELRAQAIPMAHVRNRAFAMPREVLLGAVARALSERRPEIAIGAMDAIRASLPLGTRVASVPQVLAEALSSDHRGVRFAAADCIAHMNPTTPFAGSAATVANLREGLVEAGGRLALTIFSDQDDALSMRALLRKSHVAAFNEPNGFRGLQRALSYAHDLIILGTEIDKMSTADLIRRLRADYRTRNVPIFVVAEDAKLEQHRATFEDAENGITVLNRSVDALRLRDDILGPLFEGKNDPRTRSAGIAARAAEAILYLASRDNSFDLEPLREALIAVLENRSDDVRVPACQAVASLGVRGAEATLNTLLEEGEANSVALRVAALRALGAINRSATSLDPRTAANIEKASMDTNVKISTAGASAAGQSQLRPATFDK